jgi:hypothetical protein
MAEFRGLDHLQRQLEDASKAFQSLDGEVARVAFDPNDQATSRPRFSTLRLSSTKSSRHIAAT